jgi:outer membrane lipoprotein carrier protein
MKQPAVRSCLSLLIVFLLVTSGNSEPAVETTPAEIPVVVTQPVTTRLMSAPEGTAQVATAPAATVPVVAADRVALVESHYRDLIDLTAKVVQKNFLKSVGKTQTFSGTLSIKRPGKLRLEYTNGQLIVIDGRNVWFYSKKSTQAIRRTFKDFEQANIPVAFLLGAGAIRQDFDVALPEAGKPFLLDLTPKRSGAAMKKLRLETDGSGSIGRMIIFDKSGNTSDVVFSEVKEGVGLDDGLFAFKVPKGTEVIEQ